MAQISIESRVSIRTDVLAVYNILMCKRNENIYVFVDEATVCAKRAY